MQNINEQNDDINYYQKYTKYKTKYLNLKLHNGKNKKEPPKNIIVHISGSPGSGKTTLGNKIKKHYGNNIVVKDLDDLFKEYIAKTQQKFNPKKYQKYIDNFIENNNKKTIIFVGLNKEHMTATLYDVRPDYKYFIDLPIEVNLERHFNREINAWLDWMKSRDKNILFGQLLDNEKKVMADLTDSLSNVLDISHQKNFILSFIKIYKDNGYIFLDSDMIYKKIIDLLH